MGGLFFENSDAKNHDLIQLFVFCTVLQKKVWEDFCDDKSYVEFTVVSSKVTK